MRVKFNVNVTCKRGGILRSAVTALPSGRPKALTQPRSSHFPLDLLLTMVNTRPDKFPDLPLHPSGETWPAVICEAHQILSTAYSDSAALLRFEDGDPLRLHLHATQILKRKVPILQALEKEVGDPAWIARCAEALGILVRDLLDEAVNADSV